MQLGAAGDFGTRAHKYFEDMLVMEKSDLSSVVVEPGFETVVANFIQWRESMPDDFKVVENEKMVYSAQYLFAGAVDAVIRVNDKLIIMDWKTSNRIQNEYALQASAYAKAYEEMTGLAVDEAWIVRFDKIARKMPQVKVVHNISDCFETFLCAKRLWSFSNASQSGKRAAKVKQ